MTNQNAAPSANTYRATYSTVTPIRTVITVTMLNRITCLRTARATIGSHSSAPTIKVTTVAQSYEQAHDRLADPMASPIAPNAGTDTIATLRTGFAWATTGRWSTCNGRSVR